MKANIRIGGSYKKRVGKDGATTTIVIPPEVISREAEEAGLSAVEFIKCHKVKTHYDNLDSAFYTFKSVVNTDERE